MDSDGHQPGKCLFVLFKGYRILACVAGGGGDGVVPTRLSPKA